MKKFDCVKLESMEGGQNNTEKISGELSSPSPSPPTQPPPLPPPLLQPPSQPQLKTQIKELAAKLQVEESCILNALVDIDANGQYESDDSAISDSDDRDAGSGGYNGDLDDYDQVYTLLNCESDNELSASCEESVSLLDNEMLCCELEADSEASHVSTALISFEEEQQTDNEIANEVAEDEDEDEDEEEMALDLDDESLVMQPLVMLDGQSMCNAEHKYMPLPCYMYLQNDENEDEHPAAEGADKQQLVSSSSLANKDSGTSLFVLQSLQFDVARGVGLTRTAIELNLEADNEAQLGTQSSSSSSIGSEEAHQLFGKCNAS